MTYVGDPPSYGQYGWWGIFPPNHPCPTCGHCPTCGRGGYMGPYPHYPEWIYLPHITTRDANTGGWTTDTGTRFTVTN